MIDLRTLRPLDIDTIIASVKKTNRLVTVEEGWGPWASAPRSRPRWWRKRSTTSTRRRCACAGEDVPMPYAANLEALALPTAEKIVSAVKKVTYK